MSYKQKSDLKKDYKYRNHLNTGSPKSEMTENCTLNCSVFKWQDASRAIRIPDTVVQFMSNLVDIDNAAIYVTEG